MTVQFYIPNDKVLVKQVLSVSDLIYPDSTWEEFTIVRPYSWQWVEDGGWSSVSSYHYFCPICCLIWAKAEVVVKDDTAPYTQALTHPCCKHKTTQWEVSGSLLTRWGPQGMPQDPPLMDYLPERLLQREFELHLKHQEEYGI